MSLTVEERINGANIFFENYLQGYRDRVKEYYSTESKDGKAFKLIEPTRITMLLFESETFFLFVRSIKDELETLVVTEDQNRNYNELLHAPAHVKEKYILGIAGIEQEHVIELISIKKIGTYPLLAFKKESHDSLPSESYWYGKNRADFHYNGHQLEKEIQRVVEPSSDFPLFNIEQTISKVDDEQFRYELKEAIKAYNTGLFLASTITAAVSLETLLKIAVIKKLGEALLPKNDNQKYTLNYSKILLDGKVINERLNHRIKSINELRRGGAHSKTGEVQQWDAEQVISGVKIVVDAIFKD